MLDFGVLKKVKNFFFFSSLVDADSISDSNSSIVTSTPIKKKASQANLERLVVENHISEGDSPVISDFDKTLHHEDLTLLPEPLEPSISWQPVAASRRRLNFSLRFLTLCTYFLMLSAIVHLYLEVYHLREELNDIRSVAMSRNYAMSLPARTDVAPFHYVWYLFASLKYWCLDLFEKFVGLFSM